MAIDNGNPLLLAAKHAALAYLETIGAVDRLPGPKTSEFAFMDRATRERWTVNINDGPLPLWLFDAKRRPLVTKATDFLGMVKLLLPTKRTMGEVIDCSGPAYDRFLQPLMLAALNTAPKEGAASLARQLIRQTMMRGGIYVRPLIAHDELCHALVEPPLVYQARRNA